MKWVLTPPCANGINCIIVIVMDCSHDGYVYNSIIFMLWL